VSDILLLLQERKIKYDCQRSLDIALYDIVFVVVAMLKMMLSSLT
jgi:hypothetical protein